MGWVFTKCSHVGRLWIRVALTDRYKSRDAAVYYWHSLAMYNTGEALSQHILPLLQALIGGIECSVLIYYYTLRQLLFSGSNLDGNVHKSQIIFAKRKNGIIIFKLSNGLVVIMKEYWRQRGKRWCSSLRLQAGRSRARFPVRSLGFFIDIILSAALRPWGRHSH
jgi:hypothetical protein